MTLQGYGHLKVGQNMIMESSVAINKFIAKKFSESQSFCVFVMKMMFLSG